MRSRGNPILNSIAKDNTIPVAQATYKGITLKTIFLTLLTILAGVLVAYYGVSVTRTNNSAAGITDIKIAPWILYILAFSGVISLILFLLAVFIPSGAIVFAPLYSIVQGSFLGTITALLEIFFPGIGIVTIAGTIIIFLVMLTLYSLKIFRVTRWLVKFMIFGFIAILFGSLLGFIVTRMNPLAVSIEIQIITSIFVLLYASIMLIFDFNYASQIVDAGVDKKYEWQASFGIIVTLIWIYAKLVQLITLLLISKDR